MFTDSAPPVSIALHSFMTAGVLATSLTAAVLALSSATLEAAGTLTCRDTFFSDPTTNLHGMVGHLQVFVLADWLLVYLPVEYFETTKGLRWLLPREKLPWKKASSSMWPNKLYTTETELEVKQRQSSYGFPPSEVAQCAYKLNLTSYSSYSQGGRRPISTGIYRKNGWLPGLDNVTMKNLPYGLPLDSTEYFTYFLRGEPLSASRVIKRMERYTGWRDLEMNLFWLGIGGVGLLTTRTVTLLFLRWRTQTPAHGRLSVPRFELFLLIIMLPCICQSAAFVIRGGTARGILTGTLLLAIPGGFILSICLFLIIIVFSGSFAQYTEVRRIEKREPWHTKLWLLFTGRPEIGKWRYREGLPSSFLPRFGILFENCRGPPMLVIEDQNYPNSKGKQAEVSLSGNRRMGVPSSVDSNEEYRIPKSKRLLGCARSSYIVLDLFRRATLGIAAGAFSSGGLKQSLFALAITLVQFIYLFFLKPYISRAVNAVESVSLLCEAGLFMLSTSLNDTNSIEDHKFGYAMLGFLFVTYVSHMINEWYAIINCLLSLSKPQPNSFKLGLKNAARGLLLLLLPRSYCSRGDESSRLKTGPDSVPCSSVMTAIVVPVVSPGLSPDPSTSVPMTAETGLKPWEGKQVKGLKLEPENEMKQLRKLARASFSVSSNYERGSTSYGP